MMESKGVHEFMGEGAFCWFHGIVEDIQDPLEAGRVRVRCFGYHSTSKKDIPTEHLPWAFVMMPNTSASITGIGTSPHSLVNGSQVVGFFRDGVRAQHPIIMGTIVGIPGEKANPERGFNDPDGVYPLEDRIGSPDVNQLAGSSHAESLYRTSRTESLETDIETASGKQWSEPDSNANPVYPNNKVIETKSGHIIEIDDSEGKERIHLRHKTGTYHEILSDGSISSKTIGSETRIIEADGNMLVSGNMNINVNEEADITIQKNVTIAVKEGDITIRVSSGNVNLNVEGDCSASVRGNLSATTQKDLNIDADGSATINSKKTLTLSSDSNVVIKGSTVRLN